ncbi:hypothetical protein T484DRAFT_1856551, partial [Baffinella frigidus]
MRAGLGGELGILVVVENQSSLVDLNVTASYDPPSVDATSPPNIAPRGNASLTVSGAGFGTWDASASPRVGGTASEASAWTSDSGLTCAAAHGLTATLHLTVTAGSQRGTGAATLSYDAPFIPSGENVTSGENEKGAIPTAGNYTVTLGGGRFGLYDATQAGRVGVTGAEASVLVGSAIEVHSYEGAGLVNNGTNFATATGGEVTLMGSGLGVADYSAEGRVGATACEGSNWASDSSLVCMAASGVGETRSFAVTAGVQVGSLMEAGSYGS